MKRDYSIIEDALPRAQVGAGRWRSAGSAVGPAGGRGVARGVRAAPSRPLHPPSVHPPAPQFLLIKDAGHACYLDAPQHFNSELRRFLENEVLA